MLIVRNCLCMSYVIVVKLNLDRLQLSLYVYLIDKKSNSILS